MMISCMENKVKRLMLTTIDDGKHGRFEKYKDEFDYLLSSQVALGTLAIAEPKFPLVQSGEKKYKKIKYIKKENTGIADTRNKGIRSQGKGIRKQCSRLCPDRRSSKPNQGRIRKH